MNSGEDFLFSWVELLIDKSFDFFSTLVRCISQLLIPLNILMNSCCLSLSLTIFEAVHFLFLIEMLYVSAEVDERVEVAAAANEGMCELLLEFMMAKLLPTKRFLLRLLSFIKGLAGRNHVFGNFVTKHIYVHSCRLIESQNVLSLALQLIE